MQTVVYATAWITVKQNAGFLEGGGGVGGGGRGGGVGGGGVGVHHARHAGVGL